MGLKFTVNLVISRGSGLKYIYEFSTISNYAASETL